MSTPVVGFKEMYRFISIAGICEMDGKVHSLGIMGPVCSWQRVRFLYQGPQELSVLIKRSFLDNGSGALYASMCYS